MEPVEWVMLIIAVLGVAYAATRPGPPGPPPAALEDFQLPTAEEGRAIPVVFGTAYITGPNVCWYGNLRAFPIRTKSGK